MDGKHGGLGPGKSTRAADVFISCSGKSAVKALVAIPLADMFRAIDLKAFLDEEVLRPGYLSSKVVRDALDSCRVFIPLVDVHYVKSLFCMNEARQALDHGDVMILPVFLSRIDDLPISRESLDRVIPEWDMKESFERDGWTREKLLLTVRDLLQINGFRAYEEKTFTLSFVVASVEALLETGKALMNLDLQQLDGQQRVKRIDVLTSQSLVPDRRHTRDPSKLPTAISHNVETPPFEVFISHAGNMKSTLALPLARMLESIDLRTFVDTASLKPGDISLEVISNALKNCKVFLALVDNREYIRSLHCVEELRQALSRVDCHVLPVFLSRVSDFPRTITQLAKLVPKDHFDRFKSRGWTYEKLLQVFVKLCDINGLRPIEDKEFQMPFVVACVEQLIVSGKGLSYWDKDKREVKARIKEIQASSCKGSVLSRAKSVERCKVLPVSGLYEETNQELYARIKKGLLTSQDDPGVIGITGARGVGKTWLARKLGRDPDLISHFRDGILFVTLQKETEVSETALRNLYADLRGDNTGSQEINLSNAAEYYSSLFRELDPEALLIIDNVCNTEALEIFAQAMQVKGGIKVLVTSRIESYVLRTFGFGKSVIIRMPLLLKIDDALLLMRSRSKRYKVVGDVDAMQRLAKLCECNLEALSVLTQELSREKSWGDVLEDSPELARVRRDLKQKLREAFDCEFAESPEAKEKLIRLGVFAADTSFTVDDVRHLWTCSGFHAEQWLRLFAESSLVEKTESKPAFFIRDLVRQFAREIDESLTTEYEREYADKIESLVKEEKVEVTQQMFDWAGTNFRKTGKSDVLKNLRDAEGQALKGKIKEGWGGNEFVVLKAVQNYRGIDYSPLSGATAIRPNRHFFERALRYHSNLRLLSPSWLNPKEQSLLEFVQALGAREIGESSNGIGLSRNQAFTGGETNTMNLDTLTITLAKDVTNVLGDMLLTNKTLVEFGLDSCSIDEAGCRAIATSLKVNKTLRRIILTNNQIGNALAADLANSLHFNTSLQSMDLGCNQIGDSGAEAFAKSLKNNTFLLCLNLDGNEIGDRGAVALAESLRVGIPLQRLSLDRNKITDTGAIEMANSLRTNSSLRALMLAYNQIGDAGADSFAALLSLNKTLHELELTGNKLRGKTNIVKALHDNRSSETGHSGIKTIGSAGIIG